MRRGIKLLRAALRVLNISRPADPRDCAYFDRVAKSIERWVGKIQGRRRPMAKR